MDRGASRLSRALKFAGVLSCALIMAAWAFSHSGYVLTYSGRAGGLMLYDGSLCQSFSGRRPAWIEPGFRLLTRQYMPAMDDIYLPLWLPLVMIAIPTVLLWWRDRKRPHGYCPCGYDLTGNVTGVCPECGQAVRLDRGSRTCRSPPHT